MCRIRILLGKSRLGASLKGVGLEFRMGLGLRFRRARFGAQDPELVPLK